MDRLQDASSAVNSGFVQFLLNVGAVKTLVRSQFK